MLQAVMANQNVKINDKRTSASTNLSAAIGGITGGLLLVLTGIIMSAISFVSQAKFHGLEVIMLVVSFVLLAVGSHFLDKIEADKKAAKIEYCKRYGLTNERCEEHESAKEQFN